MKSVFDEPVTTGSPAAQTKGACRFDEAEAEVARKIEDGINQAKAAISEKFADGKLQTERLLKQGRYAIEDGVGELAHKIKKNPITFLGIAFAAGAAFGLLLAHSSQRQNTD